MSGDQEHRRRKRLRLKDYDYAQPNVYFVTIACHRRLPLLNSKPVRALVESVWQSLPTRSANIELDDYVIMPDHFHGIIILIEEQSRRIQGAASSTPTADSDKSPGRSFSDIIRAFKSITAIRANKILDRCGRPFWQRSSYEHIVRNDIDLNEIRRYIRSNPLRRKLTVKSFDVRD